ncbi:MAG: hypothetical protein M3Q65_12490 [Chloroflexota bacterium]|nr:hypothetical protein [Chloroflexota bacterium]
MKGRKTSAQGRNQRGQLPKRPPPAPPHGQLCLICLDRVPPERFAEHHARCLQRRAELEQLEAQFQRPPELRTPGRHTRDGYAIDHCVLCHRRVCLVPNNADGYTYYEIAQARASDPHACDGMPTGGRHGKLVYVDPAASTTNRINRLRRQPKHGGPLRS